MRNGSSPHAKRLDSACETADLPHAYARFVCDPKYVNEYVRMRSHAFRMRSHAFRMRVVCESHANRIRIFHRDQPILCTNLLL